MTKPFESRADSGALTLLAIGDVHLGMRPGSLPDGLDQAGVDPRVLTPEAALSLAVDYTLGIAPGEAQGEAPETVPGMDGGDALGAGGRRRVDAVLFAGDVVESTNARFEALRPLERAVRRWVEAGIPVFAVAGNHDVEALPRLARMIEGFDLIGEGGRWQSRLIESAAGTAVELLGWSFPESQVRHSPVDQLLRDPLSPARPGLARIGLLHADLDASGGHYAPVTRRELTESGLDAWLLGHIHQPSLPEGRLSEASGRRGYLGSLVGLDPGEVGQRGPWLVRVGREGEIVTQHLPLAPIRWERFELQVGEDEGPEDLGDRLLVEIERFGDEIRARQADAVRDEGVGFAAKAIGVRPILVGPTRHYEALRSAVRDGRWNGLMRSSARCVVFVDKVMDRLELALDLEALSSGDDPAALMARKLLLLRAPSAARSELLEEAREVLRGRALESRWRALHREREERDPLADDADVAALLIRSGTDALNALLEQRDAARGSDS